jgi:hypothetical protein
MKLKVVNAFSNGEHQVLWLAGGMAVYRKLGYEEIFDTLDEALKRSPVTLTRDQELIEQWGDGYKLPADEEHDCPSEFLAE